MEPVSLPSDAFRLGDLVVVPSLNRLVRGAETADLEPRVMRVLAVLAETPGEVVPRAALVDAVWTDAVVNDEALTRAVSELRKALAPEASGAVETIRGTGYRLAVPPRPLAPAPRSAPAAGPRTGLAAPPPEEARPVARRQRGGALVALALGLASLAFALALWAAWPRVAEAPEPGGEPPATAAPEASGAAPERRGTYPLLLDSTSEYYRPGLSEHGVYYDSTTDRYFRAAE